MISPMLRRCLLDRIDWADPTWKLWVEQEQVTRLCIHWYEFRCIRGFLSFPPSDHPGYRHSMLLPAADELWRAETAEQWHKLRMPLHRPCSEIDSLQLHRITRRRIQIRTLTCRIIVAKHGGMCCRRLR